MTALDCADQLGCVCRRDGNAASVVQCMTTWMATVGDVVQVKPIDPYALVATYRGERGNDFSVPRTGARTHPKDARDPNADMPGYVKDAPNGSYCKFFWCAC